MVPGGNCAGAGGGTGTTLGGGGWGVVTPPKTGGTKGGVGAGGAALGGGGGVGAPATPVLCLYIDSPIILETGDPAVKNIFSIGVTGGFPAAVRAALISFNLSSNNEIIPTP